MKTLLLISFLIFSVNLIAQQETSVIKLEKGVELIGVVDRFIASEHDLDSCELVKNIKAICLIDKMPWYGGDMGAQPVNKLTQLKIKINNEEIALDVSGMFNPNFGYILNEKQFKLKKIFEGYILYGYFSDGAGTYTAAWKIIKNGAIRTLISNDDKDFNWQTE